MRIVTKKVLINYEPKRIITDIEGILTDAQLPKKYTGRSSIDPCFYLSQNVCSGNSDKGYYEYQDILYREDNREPFHKVFIVPIEALSDDQIKLYSISEEEFQRFLRIVEAGIEHLKEITLALPVWEGEETFIFS